MKTKITQKRIRAMKEKDAVAKGLYDTILGEIQLRESRGETLNDDAIIKIVLKMTDSCEMMLKNGNASAGREVALCHELLPEMLTKLEMYDILHQNAEFMEEVSHIDNRMKLMPKVKALFETTGKTFDGKLASEVLRSLVV